MFLPIPCTVALLLCSTSLAIARDPWLQPFARESIWNTPIGSEAKYHGEGHFKQEGVIKHDTEFHHRVSAAAPERDLFEAASWPVVDGQQGKFLRKIRIDDEILQRVQVSNNCAAFLMPDGETLEQIAPFIRFQPGGNVIGIPAPFNGGISLRGDGIQGAHWGSRMSSLGGTLRHGHLTGKVPIRFALKFNCMGKKYLHYDRQSKTPGYRWPAFNADSYAGKSPEEGGYSGKDPQFVMGSLLAIHPRHTAASLGLKTKQGLILFAALQSYGAYLVDDAGDDSYHFSLSHEAHGEFVETYGHSFNAAKTEGPGGDWFVDCMKLANTLSLVSNNGPGRIGGGGMLRAPLADDFGPLDVTPPSVPGSLRQDQAMPITVNLAWSAATDANGISCYRVETAGSSAQVETFGRTSATLTGLRPDTSYQVTIRSKDRAGLWSARSAPLAIRTAKVPQGTVLEDFDSGGLPGWKLENGTGIRSGRLEMQLWDGMATAILDTPSPASFRATASLRPVGGAPLNLTFIYLRHRDYQNCLWIEIPGGNAPLTLRQRIDGKESTLATGPAWQEADRFSLTLKEGRLSFHGKGPKGTVRHFHEQPVPNIVNARFGFGVNANSTTVDDLNVHPLP